MACNAAIACVKLQLWPDTDDIQKSPCRLMRRIASLSGVKKRKLMSLPR